MITISDDSPEDDPDMLAPRTTPSRTPFYSFTSRVGLGDLIRSAGGIGLSDQTNKPRLAGASHLRSGSTPADRGVGTSDASPGVGSSDTSPRADSTNKHLRAGAGNTPLRAGPGSARTYTTGANPSDDSQTAIVVETGPGVGASDVRPGTHYTRKPGGVGAGNSPLRAGNTPLRAGKTPLRAGKTPLRAGPGSTKISTTRADPSDDSQTATGQVTVLGVGVSDERDFWDSPVSQRPRNRRYTFRRVQNESDSSNDSQDALTMSQEINGLLNHVRNGTPGGINDQNNTQRPPNRGSPAPGEENNANRAAPDTPSADQQPQRQGTTLIIWFPLPRHFKCTETACPHVHSGKSWTCQRVSLVRHLSGGHNIKIGRTRYKCAGCRKTLGQRPSTHSCARLQGIMAARQDDSVQLAFPCNRPNCDFSCNSVIGKMSHELYHVRRTGPERRNDNQQDPEGREPPRTQAPDPAPHRPDTLPPPPTNPILEPTPPPPASPIPLSPVPSPTPSPPPILPPLQHPQPHRPPPPLSPIVIQVPFPQHPSPIHPDPTGREDEDRASPEASGEDDNEDHVGDVSQILDNGDEAVRLDQEPDEADQQELQPDEATQDWALEPFYAPLLALLRSPDWGEFSSLLNEITEAVQAHCNIRVDESRPAPPAIDVNNCKAIQRLYRRNRRRAVRLITSGESRRCEIPCETIERHFSEVLAAQPPIEDPATLQSIPEAQEDRAEINLDPIREGEVGVRLMRAENSAPGNDRITYRHWKQADPDCKVIAAIFNICLQQKKIPQDWKTSRTILIPKDGDPHDINNWRPIALCRTIYKLYTGVLAARLRRWIEQNQALCSAQKGFMASDGVLEHNYIIQHYLDEARDSNKEICIASLDLTNAFGSVPLELIDASLTRMGVGADFVTVIQGITRGNSTKIQTASGETNDIPADCGVRQGCPISGLLFNIAIEPIVRSIINTGLQEDPGLKHPCLAYADDITLLSRTAEGLQNLINITSAACEELHLKLNPRKCSSMHMSGRQPRGMRNSIFTIGESQICSRRDGEETKFLGRPVGFHLLPNANAIDEFKQLGVAIMSSKLAPWQRIDALKSFVFPTTVFAMRTWQLRKGDWQELDDRLRPLIKETLYLPQRATNGYLYGKSAAGSCGIPLAAEDSDIFVIDSAFKLLTTPDLETRNIARDDCKRVTSRRIRQEATLENVCQYLSKDDLEQRPSGHETLWSRARNSSGRLNTKWSTDGDALEVCCGERTMTHKERRLVARNIRNHHRSLRDDDLRSKPDQGKVMEQVGRERASSAFIRDGAFTTFADWRFIHRARLNLLPLNGARRFNTNGDQRCRRCRHQNETLPHVINHCLRLSNAMIQRHNALVDRILKASEGRHWKIISTNRQVPGTNNVLRPDIVLEKNGEVMLIDVTCPFENGPDAFAEARLGKEEKYAELAATMRRTYRQVTVYAFIVGSLGSYDPKNDKPMNRLASRRYQRLFRRLCVSDTIRWSRMMYIEHITGARQY
ncbi:uncharacterized protein [Procambarus clarkii]|uniref:uncharacterized protein n=1 Tax=Procambarus clarkii TaxID=6728 RepID=UPI00374302FC